MQKLKSILFDKRFILTLWFGLSLFAVMKDIIAHPENKLTTHNNYIIYKHNFLNLIHQQKLFGPEPQYYFDLNHYGPVFGLVIAPFAVLPNQIGVVLWTMFLAFILYYAIVKLPLNNSQKLVILLLNVNSLMGSSGNVQVNPLIVALVIFSFIFIRKQQDFWAALMIILGTAIKLYGVVGLAFFFFSDNKLKFIVSLIFWSAVLFVLPMLVSSPAYIIQTYRDWYPDLLAKNAANLTSTRGNVSVMGMIAKIFSIRNLSNTLILIPAVLVFGASMLRIKYWHNIKYQLLLLASVLIFTIIFSTSSEPPTYIIAFIGVGIWYVNLGRPITGYERFLIIFALVGTSFSASDLMPAYLRKNYFIPYALMALPCLVIWLKLIYEMLTRDFDKKEETLQIRTVTT
ncbi:glycosyltransferase family 87 protein [Mucilaginibacter lutimaris]|uniref:Glycosyltransferase family 87 protein n=1 Tax=Mucilaginibacter lutimaris TaxID=931629 RepID=A0ABW2ZFB9_9SPHI